MIEQWLFILATVVAVFAIIGAGAAVRLAGWLTEEADESLVKLIINLLLPCLIFDTALGSAALERPDNVLLPPVVGFSCLLVGMTVGLIVGRLGKQATGIETPAERGAFATCVGIFNYSYIPIPMISLLFSDQEVVRRTLAVLFVHNFGVDAGLWTLGVMLIRGKAVRKRSWRQMASPPGIAILVALGLNFARPALARYPAMVTLAQWLDLSLGTTIQTIGRASVPISILLIGAVMADQVRREGRKGLGGDAAKTAAWACLLRLGLLPALFLVAGRLLPLSDELKRVMAIEAAMPAAVFPIIMVRHFGGDTKTALRVVLSTSVVSLLTMPWWITAGLAFLGLPPAG